jgi:hypothetical protein
VITALDIAHINKFLNAGDKNIKDSLEDLSDYKAQFIIKTRSDREVEILP